MLEKHILEAQAKALAYEEREDEKRKKICSNPDEFGVPPAKSFFSHCLDDALLKEHGLLVPSDYYYKNKQPFCPMPKSELPDGHLRDTIASRARNLAKSSIIEKFKTRTPAISDIEELHKSGSEMSDDAKSLFSDDEDNYVKFKIKIIILIHITYGFKEKETILERFNPTRIKSRNQRRFEKT